MRRSSHHFCVGLLFLGSMVSIAIVSPSAVSASDEIVTMIVRFAEGEVEFPDDSYDNAVSLEDITFKTQQLKSTLVNSGVLSLEPVCLGWRHLKAPQYDIHGNEIAIEKMVDFADVYRLEWTGSVHPRTIRMRLEIFDQVIYVDTMPFMDLHYAAPNDSLFSEQWGLHNTGQSFSEPESIDCVTNYDINALEAWDIQDILIST